MGMTRLRSARGATPGGSQPYFVLSLLSVVIPLGMTGFDSVTLVVYRLCPGWQRFPLPTCCKPLIAKSNFMALVEKVANSVQLGTPALAFA